MFLNSCFMYAKNTLKMNDERIECFGMNDLGQYSYHMHLLLVW